MAIVVESVDQTVAADTYDDGLSWTTESGTLVVYGTLGKRLAEYPLGVWRRVYDNTVTSPAG